MSKEEEIDNEIIEAETEETTDVPEKKGKLFGDPSAEINWKDLCQSTTATILKTTR